jgi:chromosome segregation ATPase
MGLKRKRTTKEPKENVVPDPNPSDLLQQLRDSLKSSKENSANLVKEISVMESRVADLSRITGEIDQKVSAYDKARSGLDKQRSESDDFAKAKQKMLEDSLPDKQSIVDAKKHGDDDLKSIMESLKQSSEKVDKAQAEL